MSILLHRVRSVTRVAHRGNGVCQHGLLDIVPTSHFKTTVLASSRGPAHGFGLDKLHSLNCLLLLAAEETVQKVL